MSELTKPCYYNALLYCNTVKENLHHKQMDEMSFGVWGNHARAVGVHTQRFIISQAFSHASCVGPLCRSWGNWWRTHEERVLVSSRSPPPPPQYNTALHLRLMGYLFLESPVHHITPHINHNSTKLRILFKGLGRALVTLWARYLHAHKQNPDKNSAEVSLKILHDMKFTLLLWQSGCVVALETTCQCWT